MGALFDGLLLETRFLHSNMISPEGLESLCRELGKDLKIEGVDSRKLLRTIAHLESTSGTRCSPRHEPAYLPSGLYFQRSNALKIGYAEYGALVGCSWGPWQILWVNAFDLGYPFTRNPVDLQFAEVSGPYVVEYIKRCVQKGATTLEKILFAYNGGLGALKKPNDQVLKYAERGIKFYSAMSG